MTTRLWFDVEDLFEYARNNPRPSGIQRLAFELYRALHERDNGRGLVRFVRHDPARVGFRTVEWSSLASLFIDLSEKRRPRSAHRVFVGQQISPEGSIRGLGRRLPLSLRILWANAMRTQAIAFHAWTAIFLALVRGVQRRAARLAEQAMVASSEHNTFVHEAASGDWLVALGSPWSYLNYSALIQGQPGLRFALLIYDLIPLRHPEWCDPNVAQRFRLWLSEVLPLCDALFAISGATAGDIQVYGQEQGFLLPKAAVLPIGSGLGHEHAPAQPTARLPPSGTYVLFVSTIEPRKNHMLLFRVWQRLLAELPDDKVPTLVFAGRIGWLVGDLMQQISHTGNLGGRLILIENPTDAELAALYQGCLFTLFPSFYEGWGLPVTESLAFGKPCLIADRTSLPEAGGSLVRSFDPDNLHDAYAAIRNAIEDRADLERWEAQVRREFRPVPWSATVEALLTGLGHPLARSGTEVDLSNHSNYVKYGDRSAANSESPNVNTIDASVKGEVKL